MTDLEKMKQWLLTFPRWEQGGLLYIDFTDALPENMGLYPTGMEEVSRRATVDGGVITRNRYHFALYRVTTGQEDNAANAQWLLDFQKWVQEQSLAGYAPVFGDEPAQERLRAESGKLRESKAPGTGKYVVMLTAEFVKYKEGENIYGEN